MTAIGMVSRISLALLLSGIVAFALACGSTAPDSLGQAPTATLTAIPTEAPAAAPTVSSTTSSTEDREPATANIQTILATKVLDVGEQRVAFLLAGPKGIINDPTAEVTPVFLGDGSSEPMPAETATFHQWPYGIRGAYATQVNFDRPGRWRLNVETKGGETSTKAYLEMDVLEDGPVPGLGSLPPSGNNKTLDDVPSIEHLTTDFEPDPELYRLSIDEAVISGRPTVVVFATPAFCTSATCGPQVDTVSELRALRSESSNFIHVELYDNPIAIQGDLSRAELVPMADEWGFTSIPDWFNESWVFVLDSKGRIHQRFEGFATLEELGVALTAASG